MTEITHPLPAPPAKVAVLGQGYVGLPVAMAATDAGFHVVGFDIDPCRTADLAAGNSPVEDVSDDRLAAALASHRYLPSCDPADLAGFDVAVISVPTPMADGAPDLSYTLAATELVAGALTPGATVVLESTTCPGTTTEVVGPALTERTGLRPGEDFALGFSPERIDPGNPTWGLENTPKLVSGVDAASLACVRAFFDHFVERTVPTASPREAELAKLLENTFRHVNIALVNELAVYAHALGIDIWDAIDAASTKPFGFMAFTPGPGVGGHCLPIDPSYLSWKVERALGHAFRFVDLANDVNNHMPDYVASRCADLLNDRQRSVRGSRILVFGLAYKADTADARETPAADVVARLVARAADVVVDPHTHRSSAPAGARLVADLDEAADLLHTAELSVLVTAHRAFEALDIGAAPHPVLDCRNALSGPSVVTL